MTAAHNQTSQDSCFPEGWNTARAGAILVKRKGKKPNTLADESKTGLVPYLDIEAFERATIRRYAEPDGAAVVEAGTPVVVWDGARCGLAGVAICQGALGSTIMAVSTACLDHQYLRWFLVSQYDFINSNHRGTGIPHVDPGIFDELIIPIAPQAEQRRIVAKVETLLAPVNASRQRLAKAPVIVKRFRQAVLAAACSGRLTADWRSTQPALEPATQLIVRVGELRQQRYHDACNQAKATAEPKPRPYDNNSPSVRDDLGLEELPVEWAWVDLRFLMDEQAVFCYGVVQPEKDDPTGVFLIRAGDLDAGTVNTADLRKIPQAVDAQFARSRVKGGELLVTVVGAGIGAVAIVPNSCTGFNIARAVAKVPIRDFCTRYIFYWLNSATALGWLKADSREVARPTLNLEQLKTLPVPLPPIAEQHEIVRRIDALFRLADTIENRVAAATARAEKLTQAILAKAFRGELVPTEAELARREGREYEPASVLLERIKAERAKDKGKPSKPSRRQRPPQ